MGPELEEAIKDTEQELRDWRSDRGGGHTLSHANELVLKAAREWAALIATANAPKNIKGTAICEDCKASIGFSTSTPLVKGESVFIICPICGGRAYVEAEGGE